MTPSATWKVPFGHAIAAISYTPSYEHAIGVFKERLLAYQQAVEQGPAPGQRP